MPGTLGHRNPIKNQTQGPYHLEAFITVCVSDNSKPVIDETITDYTKIKEMSTSVG